MNGVSSSTHELHRGVHVIETDLAMNWGGDDSTANTHTFQVYRFIPHTNSSYTYVNTCSNRGVCNEESGLCECFNGYSDDNCGIQEAMAI